jgi:hypothetical protein
MVALMLTAIVSGVVSFILLWPYGAVVALVSVPFSSSLCVLLAGTVMVFIRGRARGKEYNPVRMPLNAI